MSFSLNSQAEENELRVIALFKNAAMVDYAGKQKLYRAGQKVSSTIQLIKADTHSATFMINGQRQELTLQKNGIFQGDHHAVPSAQGLNKVAKITRNIYGMYKTPGMINGIMVNFLVDTGASQVAMNEQAALRIGIPYKATGRKMGVSTAAGLVGAWGVMLNKVRVGGIELNNVEALVVDGVGPDEILLGMSFLNRVKMVNENNLLELTQQY